MPSDWASPMGSHAALSDSMGVESNFVAGEKIPFSLKGRQESQHGLPSNLLCHWAIGDVSGPCVVLTHATCYGCAETSAHLGGPFSHVGRSTVCHRRFP